MCSLALLIVATTRTCTMYSPHNLFSRQGVAVEKRLLRRAALRADLLIVFSSSDFQKSRTWGATPALFPLLQFVPELDPIETRSYRKTFLSSSAGPVLGFFGQIREDKGADLFARILEIMPDARGAVVGKDLGGLASIIARASDQITVIDQYLSTPEFISAMAAVDVIITPYVKASQSGVLAVARRIGVPSVSSNVGSLSEQASEVVDEASPIAYVQAIRRVLAHPRDRTEPDDQQAMTATYLEHLR